MKLLPTRNATRGYFYRLYNNGKHVADFGRKGNGWYVDSNNVFINALTRKQAANLLRYLCK